jgi:hypothetical protein
MIDQYLTTRKVKKDIPILDMLAWAAVLACGSGTAFFSLSLTTHTLSLTLMNKDNNYSK